MISGWPATLWWAWLVERTSARAYLTPCGRSTHNIEVSRAGFESRTHGVLARGEGVRWHPYESVLFVERLGRYQNARQHPPVSIRVVVRLWSTRRASR